MDTTDSQNQQIVAPTLDEHTESRPCHGAETQTPIANTRPAPVALGLQTLLETHLHRGGPLHARRSCLVTRATHAFSAEKVRALVFAVGQVQIHLGEGTFFLSMEVLCFGAPPRPRPDAATEDLSALAFNSTRTTSSPRLHQCQTASRET